VAGGRTVWTPPRTGAMIRFMRLVSRTRSSIRFLRWWLLPSPLRIMGDLAGAIAAASLLGFAKDRHLTWLEVSSGVVALVCIIPLEFSGFRLIIRSFVVDPLRGYLIHRNTGEDVYFRDGVMRRFPRHRAGKASIRARSSKHE